jgi:hypothetical protein
MFEFSWQYALVALGVFVVSLATSVLVLGALLVRLPATYFLDRHNRDLGANHPPFIRWTGILLKNVAGMGLVLFGLLLSVPGIPGQGLLTILLGLILLDLPGKRRLERWILRRPGIHARVNRLRHRFGRPPLQLTDPPRAPRNKGDST